MLIWKFSMKFIIKRCSLQLAKDGVIGNRKYLFSSKFLQLPIEKVDSILIENRIIDKLLGGQTVAIRSASGLIRFICIQNASEFVDKTLEVIKAYKESNQPTGANIPTNTSGDNLEQIKKLKEMLDNGIIAQEEFDVKKKQLLGL
ncbi:MAG: SHOCT domain-containing protein [Ruminococcus sp.]|nr:SHOCT domain-containing protein [Ruminococcus sp.]